MHIYVGSTNPVKINAVVTAASETWPEVVVTGLDVPSGIPPQPIGDEQTRQGAVNRAHQALALGMTVDQEMTKAVLGVGLEGGVVELFDQQLWSTVWVAVEDTKGNVFTSNGARFPVPKIIADRIRQGQEMGPIVNDLVGRHDVRQAEGMIGVITKHFVERTEEYTGITKMALGLWYGRDWERDLQLV